MFTFRLNELTQGRSARILKEVATAIEHGARLSIDHRARRVDVSSAPLPGGRRLDRVEYKPEAFGQSALTTFPWSGLAEANR